MLYANIVVRGSGVVLSVKDLGASLRLQPGKSRSESFTPKPTFHLCMDEVLNIHRIVPTACAALPLKRSHCHGVFSRDFVKAWATF